jgi:hypothetical protein
VEPEAWCGVCAFARLSRIPTELLVRINITDIKIMDIKILNINIMDINITDQLGSFRQGFEGACASRARELSGRTHQGAGLRCLPRERMVFGFPSRIGS